MTIVALFLLFTIKHFVSDFVFQFPYMVNEKGTYGASGGIQHAGIQGFGTIMVLLPFIGLPLALAFGLFDAVVHYHIDWIKMNIGKGLTVNDRAYWLWLGFDQMLHYLTYIFIIGLLVIWS